MLLPDSFTFYSAAHGTTSWLDHCVTTESGKSIMPDIYINKDFVCSDHFPLCVTILCNISPVCSNTVENKIRNIPK